MPSVRRDALLSAAAISHRETLPAPEFLTEDQAAALLSISPRTFERYRRGGDGPPWVKIGKHIRYRRSALLEFYAAKEVRS